MQPLQQFASRRCRQFIAHQKRCALFGCNVDANQFVIAWYMYMDTRIAFRIGTCSLYVGMHWDGSEAGLLLNEPRMIFSER